MMNREEAFKFLCEKVTADNLRKHCVATEAIMKALAPRFGGDPDLWGLTGLLHDVDLEETRGDQTKHGLVGAAWLEERGFPAEAVRAVKAHNSEHTGFERVTPFEISLSAAETLTGMIVATTLVYPDKKVASVKPKSVSKRMKEPRFAANIARDCITQIEKAGMKVEDLIETGLRAMQSAAAELGL